jgi:hypothetical protein
MNKRIRALAKESGYVYHVGGTVPYFEFTYNQLEKFAELIVRECANRATWAQDTGERDIGGEVLKHFGDKP